MNSVYVHSDWLLDLRISCISFYQTRKYPLFFSRALIGYSSSGYPALLLVCKTEWMRAQVITFPAEFWLNKFIFYRWLFTGFVYTKIIIYLHLVNNCGLVSTQPVNIAFRTLWLATQARVIHWIFTGYAKHNGDFDQINFSFCRKRLWIWSFCLFQPVTISQKYGNTVTLS